MEYHTDPSDKKKHVYLEYKKKGMAGECKMEDLLLNDKRFTRVSEMRELGLNISTVVSNTSEKAIVSTYGYRFSPEVSKCRSLAYRMQYIKNMYPPTFMRQMVMSYFCGTVRFGSCLYWCRSTEEELDTIRFYYVMASSAVLGLNAYDIVGSSCCKRMTVKGDNKEYLHLLDIVDLPTIKKMALVDSVSTVRQVAELVPDFFKGSGNNKFFNKYLKRLCNVDNGNRSSGRIRSNVDRYGIDAAKRSIRDNSKEVKEANLPNELSLFVVESDAIIGDIWRLACEEVKIKKLAREYVLRKYEQLYEVSKRYVTDSNGNTIFMRALEEYKTLCKIEFNIIEIQERRLHFRTPTKMLVANSICKTSPPEWESPVSRKRLFFTCDKETPVKEYGPIDEKYMSFDIHNCVICGCNIIPKIVLVNGKKSASWSRGACKSCGRYAHQNCLDKCFISSKSFICKKIRWHLGPGGIDIEGLNSNLYVGEPPIRRQHMCIICGSTTLTDSFKYVCSNECKFSAHLECIRVLCRATNIEIFDRNTFCCDLVEYHLKPSEVNSCRTFIETKIKALRTVMKRRGKIQTHRYSMKRKRWLNDEIECEYCGRWYGANETNHLGTYCSGMSSYGLSQDSRNYPFAQLKRFRHITWKVP